jgi:hypothetical protein
MYVYIEREGEGDCELRYTVGIVTRLWAGRLRSRCSIPARDKIFLSSIAFRVTAAHPPSYSMSTGNAVTGT